MLLNGKRLWNLPPGTKSYFLAEMYIDPAGELPHTETLSHFSISLPYFNFHSTPSTIIRDILSQTEDILVWNMEGISLWMQNSPLIRGDCSQRSRLLLQALGILFIPHKNWNVSK